MNNRNNRGFDFQKGLMRIIMMIALLSCPLCLAPAADECKPSTLNIPSAPYPGAGALTILFPGSSDRPV
jgi:hypothetical protein